MAIAELAARQHGVIARWQLLELGLGREAIKHRSRTGRLHRLYRGVYALGHRRASTDGRRTAAALAFGPEAVVSHRDAGAVWAIWRDSGRLIDVTVPRRSAAGLDGIRLHRVRALDPRDRTREDNIPVTTVARTLLDLAEVLRPRQLERALEESERLRLFDLTAIRATCERSPGRRGLASLRACLRATHEEAGHTKSDLERLFLTLCTDEGLPTPAVNAVVEGFEVDAHWPGTNLIVELDSWEFHRTRAAFERDRERGLRLRRADYDPIRLTWRQLTAGRAELATTLRALLDSARTPRAPGPGALARASP